MIIKDKASEGLFVKTLSEINRLILGEVHQLHKDKLNQVISSDSYIDDDKLSILYICRSICKDHLFVDGNKRTALVVLQLLSDQLGFQLKVTDNQLYHIMIDITTSNIDLRSFINKIW